MNKFSIRQKLCWEIVRILHDVPKVLYNLPNFISQEFANTDMVLSVPDIIKMLKDKHKLRQEIKKKKLKKQAKIQKAKDKAIAEFRQSRVKQELQSNYYLKQRRKVGAHYYFSHREEPIDFRGSDVHRVIESFYRYFDLLKTHNVLHFDKMGSVITQNNLLVHREDFDAWDYQRNQKIQTYTNLINMEVLSICLHAIDDDKYFVFKGKQYGDILSFTKKELMELNKFYNFREAAFNYYYTHYSVITTKHKNSIQTSAPYVPLIETNIESIAGTDMFCLIDITTEKPETKYEKIERIIE